MRHPSALAVPLLIAALGSPAPADAAPGAPVHRFELANGMQVVLVPRPGSATVGVAMAYAVGSASDPRGYQGLTHLAEHLAARLPTATFGGAFEVLEGVGATGTNASTYPDATVFYTEVPSRAWSTAVWLEAMRMVVAPDAFDDRALEIEKEVVRRERERWWDNWGHWVFLEALFPPGHPYFQSRHRFGDIGAPDIEDMQGFLQRTLVPELATLVLVGDVSAEALEAEVRRSFGSVPARGSRRPILTGADTPANCEAWRRPFTGAGSSLWLAWRLPAGLDQARLHVLAGLVFEGALRPRIASGKLASARLQVVPGREAAVLIGSVDTSVTGTIDDLSTELRSSLESLEGARIDELAEPARRWALAEARAALSSRAIEAREWARALTRGDTTPGDLPRRISSLPLTAIRSDAAELAASAPTVSLEWVAEGAGGHAWAWEREDVDCR